MSESSAQSDLSKQIVELTKQGYSVSFWYDQRMNTVVLDVRSTSEGNRQQESLSQIELASVDVLAFRLGQMGRELFEFKSGKDENG